MEEAFVKVLKAWKKNSSTDLMVNLKHLSSKVVSTSELHKQFAFNYDSDTLVNSITYCCISQMDIYKT